MTTSEKRQEIENLTSQINDLKWKIKAGKLKIKYAKNTGLLIDYTLEDFRNIIIMRMIYAQIQTIQAIPIYPKGGIAYVDGDRDEIIIKRA